jgi:hypothetical protein
MIGKSAEEGRGDYVYKYERNLWIGWDGVVWICIDSRDVYKIYFSHHSIKSLLALPQERYCQEVHGRYECVHYESCIAFST